MRDKNRRQFLKTVALGGLASTTGCLGIIGGGDNGSEDEQQTRVTAATPFGPRDSGGNDSSGSSPGPGTQPPDGTTSNGNGNQGVDTTSDSSDSGGSRGLSLEDIASRPYFKWIPNTDDFRTSSELEVSYWNLERLRGVENLLHQSTWELFSDSFNRFFELYGTDPSRLSEIIAFDQHHVLTGDFGGVLVGTNLRGEGAERRIGFDEYNVFYKEGDFWAAATDGHMIVAPIGGDWNQPAVDRVQELVNASQGDTERLVESDVVLGSTAAPLSNVGRGSVRVHPSMPETDVSVGTISGQIGSARGWRFNRENAELQLRLTFEQGTVPERTIIEQWVDRGTRFGPYSYSISLNNRTVDIQGSVPIDQFDGLRNGSPSNRTG